jgi:hypothetical protein
MSTSVHKPYPNADHPNELGPDDVPDVYASVCKGDCLSPVFEDGACLVFSKTDVPKSGDFVGFWLHPDAVGPGELPRRVKRLVSGLPEGTGLSLPWVVRPGDEVEPLIILEQLNPPKQYYVRASRILAMHRVVGEAEADGTGQARLTRRMIGGQMTPLYDEEGVTA